VGSNTFEVYHSINSSKLWLVILIGVKTLSFSSAATRDRWATLSFLFFFLAVPANSSVFRLQRIPFVSIR
jgi:hypothetical protein